MFAILQCHALKVLWWSHSLKIFMPPLLLESWFKTEAGGGICSDVVRVSPIWHYRTLSDTVKQCQTVSDGRHAQNITANAAARFSLNPSLEEERRIKIFRLWDHHNTFKSWHCKIANIEYNFGWLRLVFSYVAPSQAFSSSFDGILRQSNHRFTQRWWQGSL